jgi:hypothetical protein
VLHVFDHSCSLISNDGGVISLVSQEIGGGPFNLVLPPIWFSPYYLFLQPLWLSSDVTSQSDVGYQNGILKVGGLSIDTTQAQDWDPYPDWHGLRRQVNGIRTKIPLLAEFLRAFAPEGGLAESVVSQPTSKPPVEKDIFRPANSSIEKLIEGLHYLDVTLCRQAAAELAGCGVGLTPEGDDFLLGCLLAVRILYKELQADKLAYAIVDVAAPKTAILSAEWLRSAARGECAWPWHALLESFAQDRPELVETAARAIIQQGHTSGSAALAGFVATMQSTF